jgi:Zn-dependent peptidase ImmA (M78 family)
MAGFKIKMARQEGERIAKEYGFDTFPIDPKQIAEKAGIILQAKPPEMNGISGALILAGNEVTIIYSQQHNNSGFENFSIAHELGHYFLPDHPDEIQKQGGAHLSRANFVEGSSIELEADHFASGLLMPSHLVRQFLSEKQLGMDGIIALANEARCSITAAAIRAAECSENPIAIIMSQNDTVAYAFMTESFKNLGQRLRFLRKGSALPISATRTFNESPDNVLRVERVCAETTLADWFDGSGQIVLDEEIIGLGNYGYTLTVLSSEELPADPDEDFDGDEGLEEIWTPRFAYSR